MSSRWLALLVGAVLFPGMAFADLRMITVDARPWAWSGDDGSLRGAFPELVAELGRRTGQPIKASIAPFARVERDLESGQQDCTIILWNDSRARIVERGEDVYMMTFGIIARQGVPLRTYEDLGRLTVSVTRGLSLDPRFDADGAIRKDFDKDYGIGVQKLAHRRLDAIAGAIPTILFIAGELGVGHHLGDRLVLTRIPLALQCSRNSPRRARLEGLNAALRDMRADGTLARILTRYRYE